MSNKFGALTDHFSLASDDLVLVDSSEVPVAQDRTDAQDENGDITASAFHGNTAGDLKEVSCTYALKSGSLNLNTLYLGELETGLVATSLEASTSNTEWPQITISGTKGVEDVCNPDSAGTRFQLPNITLQGCKRAQIMGFTVGDNCKLTGSSLSASIELAQQEDGEGEPVAHGVSGGTYEVSADFVGITASPSWTVTLAGLTETQTPGSAEGQAAWHTGSGTAAGTLTRTV